MSDKTENMRPRGVRMTDAQWSYLNAQAGKNATPSDYNRQLIDADIAKNKRKGKNGRG